MNHLIERFVWLFWRRLLLSLKLRNFQASITSFATRDVIFSEANSLHGFCRIRNSSLGRYTYINRAKVDTAKIGSFCSIGPEAIIGGLAKHPTDWLSTHPAFYSANGEVSGGFSAKQLFEPYDLVIIGNDVWIGSRAMVMPGVSIGNGAIVAAGAIVTKDVPPYMIVAGVPAKPIRMRLPSEIVIELEKKEWWNFSSEKLNRIAHCFQGSLTGVEDLKF